METAREEQLYDLEQQLSYLEELDQRLSFLNSVLEGEIVEPGEADQIQEEMDSIREQFIELKRKRGEE